MFYITMYTVRQTSRANAERKSDADHRGDCVPPCRSAAGCRYESVVTYAKISSCFLKERKALAA